MGSIIPGPVPPFSNPPIEPQFYQPRKYFIEDITLGFTTLVTTTIDNDYVVGQEVRFLIPATSGTRQLNEMTGFVISLPASDELEVDIDSSQMDIFTSSMAPMQPQIVAMGDINSGQINTSGRINNLTYIPGSFINISPL